MRKDYPVRRFRMDEEDGFKNQVVPMNEANSYYSNEAQRYFQEGYEKQAKGELEEAVKLYQKSIELFPTAEAHTFLGWAYSFQGNIEAAIAECKKAIQIDPEYGNPYNDIGCYLIDRGRYEEAQTWLEKATRARRYESYCYPYYNMGRLWEQKGDWFKALEYYTRSVRENSDYTLARKAVSRLQGLLN
jgi:Tfp pilus assembly protein PilF